MSKKENFLDEEVWVLTFGGAFQRAGVYRNDVEDNEKKAFRLAIKAYIRSLTYEQYVSGVSSDTHIENMQNFAEWTTRYADILQGGKITLGVSQKLLNLYLKYLWCLNQIAEPPHCPFDRIIISKLDIKNAPNWTSLNNTNEYKKLVQHAEMKAMQNKMSIAEWELDVFQRR